MTENIKESQDSIEDLRNTENIQDISKTHSQIKSNMPNASNEGWDKLD